MRTSGASASGGQQNALGQELANDAAPSRSERHPDGDLSCSRRRADEQEVRDVHAGDDQHEEHGAEEDQEAGTDVADDKRLQGHEPDTRLRVRVRVLTLELLREDGGGALRLGQRQVLLDSGDDAQDDGAT